MTQRKNHIYLSYTQQDKEFVDLIEAEMKEKGYPVWRDTGSIGAEEDWDTAIAAARQSAYALIIAASDKAFRSDWVRRDIAYALKSGITMVVVMLEDCDHIPQSLDQQPMVNFVDVRAASGLVDQLHKYRQAINKLVEELDKCYPIRRYLQQLRKNSDDLVREEAARALGDLGDMSAVDALIKALYDLDVDVRFAAAEALGKLRGETAVKPLIRLLGKDDDPDVRASAATALGQIQHSSAITPLIEQLDHADRFVRAAVLEALGNLKAFAAVQRIVHIMRNDPISNVRQAAEIALCVLGGEEANRALIRAKVECPDMPPA